MCEAVASRVAAGETAGLDPLAAAVLRTIVYSDLFDQPLTAAEVHRYLPVAADEAAVRGALWRLCAGGTVGWADCLVHLRGREWIVPLRRARQTVAVARWRRARLYGRLIAALPFVRLVAVTGALAVDNSDAADDVDYFIVTEPGRLWLARACVLAVVLVARRRGLALCPNYLLATSALAQPERGPYAAREIVQAVPLYGGAVYRKFIEANTWVAEELPNAQPAQLDRELDDLGALAMLKRMAECVLGGRLGELLERVEHGRKVRKLAERAARAPMDRSQFDAEHCKGHFEGHGSRILRCHAERLRLLGLVSLVDRDVAGGPDGG